MNINKGYKVFTHDFRPPVQGGNPVFNGITPFILPVTEVDITDKECSFGWNYTLELSTAFKIAGLWPTGRPSAAFVVEAENAVQRGNKCRAGSLHILRPCTEPEVEKGIEDFSKVFGSFSSSIAQEQILWRQALSRPYKDKAQVENYLEKAILCRELSFTLKEYSSQEDALAARDAWKDREAWDSWAAWEARDARAAWEARDARDAWKARGAWDSWAAWEARDARAAWEARDAITVWYSGMNKWTNQDPLLLTSGLREAYLNGLEFVMPVDKNTLGYVMVNKK